MTETLANDLLDLINYKFLLYFSLQKNILMVNPIPRGTKKTRQARKLKGRSGVTIFLKI